MTYFNGDNLLEYEENLYTHILEDDTPTTDEERLAIINLLKAYGAEK